MRGVQLAGALKNVIAIAAGVCAGLGLGTNAQAALIARGLAEICRLGLRLGGRMETFMGLAGLGDLVLTCTGELSRNRQVGIELACGRTLEQILARMRMVAEGVPTAFAAERLYQRLGLEMPITEAVCGLLRGELSPEGALTQLLERPLKSEWERLIPAASAWHG